MFLCLIYTIFSMKLFLITVVFLLIRQTLAICPSECNCTSITYQCIQCLQKFKRIYNQTTKTCECFATYVEKNPAEKYCCPPYCASCNDLGCTSCNKHFEITYDGESECYLCECVDNYELNHNMCRCKSQTSPTLYYQIKMSDSCLPCPNGCICNANGCYYCQESTKRILITDFMSSSSCFCSQPYVDINGTCTCYPGCTCTDGTVQCDNLKSHRVKTSKDEWICQTNYEEINFTCVCQQPYTYDSVPEQFPNKACICLSYSLPLYYYQPRGQCVVCPEGCECNQKGCVYCLPSLNREVSLFACPCKAPYVEFYGMCICVEPYYLFNDSGFVQCRCLSFYNSSAFIWNDQTSVCSECPKFCTCDASGCVSCPSNTLRRYVKLGSITYCPCILSAVELIDTCRCNDYSVASTYQNGTTICICQQNNNIYSQSGICRVCPINCNCSVELGCFQCDESAHRYFKTTDSIPPYSQCLCMTGYKQVDNFCQCQDPYIWDQKSDQCECRYPYVIVNGSCKCLSDTKPEDFYLDTMTNNCYSCPIGCKCNASGCLNCYPYTLRYNFRDGALMQCPCLQIAVLRYGICTLCLDGYYYVGGECLPCPTCSTCDTRGCLTCVEGSFLNDNDPYNVTCDCDNTSLININGICVCKAGQYKDSEGYCQICPKNCLDCKLDYMTGITCISCRKEVFRFDSPTTNCPCQFGYSEVGQIQSACCPNTCIDCNQAGCSACPLFSYRQLKNNSCVCMNNMIENDSINCTCPVGSYIFVNECVTCPVNCQTCYYMMPLDDVFCLSCHEGENRRMLPEYNCPCLEGFVQANPILSHCKPKHCLSYNQVCVYCSQGRVPDQTGQQCICEKGTYEGIYGTCKNCTIGGCLDCTSYNFCIQCDLDNDFYLTNTTCKHNLDQSQYLYSQSTKGITLQIKTFTDTTVYNKIYEIAAYLQQVYQNFSSDMTVSEVYNLTIRQVNITRGDTLTIKMHSPPISLQKQMLTISYVLIPSTSIVTVSNEKIIKAVAVTNNIGVFNGINLQASIYLKYIYAEQVLGQANVWQYAITQATIGLLILYHLTLYVRGFKHNQMIFFLQTLSFIGLVFEEPALSVISFLYNLKAAYYGYGNALEGLIPIGYMEHGFLNFSIFTGDANIFRVAGTTILVAFIFCILSIVLRIGHKIGRFFMKKNSRCRFGWLMKHRKFIYRTIEFIYKTCMYPLMFFALTTIKNWSGGIIASQNFLTFLNFSRGLAIFILCAYTLVTIWSVSFQTIAKINKIENALEYFCSLLNSVILVFAAGSILYLIIVFVLLFRVLLYVYFRKKFLRDFQKAQYLSILCFGLEVITLAVITTKSMYLVATFLALSLVSFIAHGETVIFFTNKLAKSSKRASPDEQLKPDFEKHVESMQFVTDGSSTNRAHNIEQRSLAVVINHDLSQAANPPDISQAAMQIK